MKLTDLRTPCAVVDGPRVRDNVARMQARMVGAGVTPRPHVKTHKCREIARMQAQGGACGLTVSTLAEAEFLLGAGMTDLTWAVPAPPQAMTRAVELAGRARALHIVADHEVGIAAASEAARRAGVRLGMFLKIDCGYHRCGVEPVDPRARALARAMAQAPGLKFMGLLTHGGHSYACRNREEIRAVAAQERAAVAEFAAVLLGEGIEVPVVSAGSTPTCAVCEDWRGVTELRPGNYVFFDAFQAAIGSCALSECAFTVLASVIGVYPARGEAIINAGALALSKDEGASHVNPACGFGVVCGLDGGPLPGVRLVSLSQEHGRVRWGPGEDPKLTPGALVRVIPNHSCLASALYSEYQVAEGGDIVDTWRPVRGW